MRGGSRPGAGRPAGALSKFTEKRRAEIEASGLTPLEYMLDILRDDNKPQELRFEAAKAAAPSAVWGSKSDRLDSESKCDQLWDFRCREFLRNSRERLWNAFTTNTQPGWRVLCPCMRISQ